MEIDPDDTIVPQDSIVGNRAERKVFGFAGGGHAYSTLASRFIQASTELVCRSMNEFTVRLLARLCTKTLGNLRFVGAALMLARTGGVVRAALSF